MLESLLAVCRSWVTHRDQLSARNKITDVPQREFTDSLRDHVREFENLVPGMSVAELEGLSQIVFEAVSQRRIRESAFRR